MATSACSEADRSLKRLVLFDLDKTLVDHEGAATEGVEQWLEPKGWADAGTIASLVSDWAAIAERHLPPCLA
jgi:FMN phosphatase YigB (HAD superfamily)